MYDGCIPIYEVVNMAGSDSSRNKNISQYLTKMGMCGLRERNLAM